MKRYRMGLLVVPCAAAMMLCGGCLENPVDADKGESGRLFVVETDFQSGKLEWLSAGGNGLSEDNIPVYSDAAARAYKGYVYILERDGADNITKIDPSAKVAEAVLYQVHLGDGWNPHDIEFVSETKAYIANQNEPSITVFNPATGTMEKQIDISAYTFNPDSNMSPYAEQMALCDGKLYVMLQRRDGWNPGAPTMILTVDTGTDEVLADDTIVCRYTNGYDMVCVGGALYITNPGSIYTTGDGGIEKISLADKSVQTIIDEDALGGNPNQIVHKSGSLFYVQNYVGWQNVSVVEVDAESGTVVETLSGVKDAYGGIAYDPEESKLYVGERDSSSTGILVFKDNEKTAGPLQSEKSLPPSNMVIVR